MKIFFKMIDRNIIPPFKSIDNIDIVRAKSIKLDNGIQIHIINAGIQPVVKIEFLFKAGAWYETFPGVSFLTTKLILEGTKNKSSRLISSIFDQYGASVDLNPGLDYVSISLYCLNKFLPNVLPLINEILFESIFPANEIQTQKTLKIQNIKVNNEKNNILAAKLFRSSIFGENHPYGHDLNIEEVQSLESDQLLPFYDTYFGNNFEIVISGLISENEIMLFNNIFGSATRKSESNTIHHLPTNNPQNTTIIKEKSLQSSIRLGKRLFKKDHSDYIKFIILNEILGGYFGSRLMKNIREDKGFTYGISSSLLTFKNEGFFAIGTDVRKENTKETIEEIYKEIEILKTVPIEEEELETVKNYMLGSFLSDINTPFSLADKFKSIYFNGLSYDYYKQFVDTINNINREEIQQIANQYLDQDSLIEVVVG
jgi:zinc protease